MPNLKLGGTKYLSAFRPNVQSSRSKGLASTPCHPCWLEEHPRLKRFIFPIDRALTISTRTRESMLHKWSSFDTQRQQTPVQMWRTHLKRLKQVVLCRSIQNSMTKSFYYLGLENTLFFKSLWKTSRLCLRKNPWHQGEPAPLGCRQHPHGAFLPIPLPKGSPKLREIPISFLAKSLSNPPPMPRFISVETNITLGLSRNTIIF